MKTTIDIPKNELEDAIRFTNAKTKREAIVTAVVDFNNRVRRSRLAKKFGTFDNFITQQELTNLRAMD